MTAGPQPPWAGPWADDARRILTILQSHDGHHAGAAQTSDEPGEPGEPGDGGVPSSSGSDSCPLCQGMALVRRSGPDVLDRVAELAAGLAATLRATNPSPTGENRETEAPPAPPAPRPPVTVPIDVSD